MSKMAIAYAVKKRGKKMAQGGMMTKDGYQSSKAGPHQDVFHEPENEKSGYVSHEGDAAKPDHAAMMEDDRELGQHGAEEEGPYGAHMAKGGEIHPEDEMEKMGPTRVGRPNTGYGAIIAVGKAEGGMMDPMHGEESKEHEEDMVGRIMKQRQHMYSEGGKVANNTHSFEYEFDEPANYDDLSRRDDLEFSYTGKNSGDELGNMQEDHDRQDMISRIMKSRAKKDKNPRPA